MACFFLGGGSCRKRIFFIYFEYFELGKETDSAPDIRQKSLTFYDIWFYGKLFDTVKAKNIGSFNEDNDDIVLSKFLLFGTFFLAREVKKHINQIYMSGSRLFLFSEGGCFAVIKYLIIRNTTRDI